MNFTGKYSMYIALFFVFGFIIYLEMVQRPHSLYIIYEGYYKCESRKGLEGGIYGTGPFKKFGPRYCKDWVAIDKAEFKSLAVHWYSTDWVLETEWWRQP